MASFPALATGYVGKYPLTRARTYRTGVVRFLDDTEQRFVDRARLEEFLLVFRDLGRPDMLAIRTFWNSMRGRYDVSWDITLKGVTYPNLTFDQDSFEPVENSHHRYTFQFKVRQVKKMASDPAMPGSLTFPTITGGVIAQRPYTHGLHFWTIANDLPTGQRHTYYRRANPIRLLDITYAAIPDTDAQTLEDFFRDCRGRYRHFDMTDPDDFVTVYAKCRFLQDGFELRQIAPNHNSVQLGIVQLA
jgi:hypothetical protein